MIELVLFIPIGVALILGFIAAYTDKNEAAIYDGTTLPMIGIGIISSLLIFYNSLWMLAFLFLSTLVLFIGGKILNKKGALGGGDVKLMMGYNLLFPFSAFAIFPISMVIGLILHFKDLNQYIRLGPIAFASFVIVFLSTMIMELLFYFI